MPTYVAFLRAINLGAKRKFPKAEIVAATEAAGGEGVQTYINTGNVRLDSALASAQEVAEALEGAYLGHIGFEVPTVVFEPGELRGIRDRARELAEHGGMSYVSLLREEPDDEQMRAVSEKVAEVSRDWESLVVEGRGAHLVLSDPDNYHQTRLHNGFVERYLGVATNRNLRVIDAVVEKWC